MSQDHFTPTPLYSHTPIPPHSARLRVPASTLLSGLLLVAFALRVTRLDFQPLWWDEGYTVFFVTRDFATMLARTALDIHPPLYYALLQVWAPLAGLSETAFRLFSVAVGLATIPLLYLFGAKFFTRRIALLSAGLLALSPLHIYYSQEVRMYGFVTLLALASVMLQLYLLTAESQIGHTAVRLAWLGYILVTAAAIYTLYYAGFLIAAELVVVLYWRWRGQEPRRDTRPCALTRPCVPTLRNWIAAWVVIAVLYLPWVIYAGTKLYSYVTAKVDIEQYARLDPITFLAQHLIAFSVGHLSAFPLLGVGALLVVGLAAFGIFRSKFKVQCSQFAIPNSRLKGRPLGQFVIPNSPLAPRPSPLAIPNSRLKGRPLGLFLIRNSLLIYLLVPLLIGWLVNLLYPFHPFGYERSLLYVAPLFYVLVALGLDALVRWRPIWAYAAAAAMLLFAAGSLYDFYTVPRYTQEDYRPLIGTIQQMAQPGDTVLAPYPWQIGYLEAYYRGVPVNLVEVPSDEWTIQPDVMDAALDSIAASGSRVWLVAYQIKGHKAEDLIANFFSNDYDLYDNSFGNTRLEYFARASDPALDAQALDFAPDLELTSFGVGNEPIIAGAGFIRLRLHWQAKSNAYNYSLRLVAANGDKALEQDGPITAGNEIERQGLFVSRTIVPGQYELSLVVYPRATMQPLVVNGQSEVVLAYVTVNAER